MSLIGVVVRRGGLETPVAKSTEFSWRLFFRWGWPYVDNILLRRFGEFKISWWTGKMEWYSADWRKRPYERDR